MTGKPVLILAKITTRGDPGVVATACGSAWAHGASEPAPTASPRQLGAVRVFVADVAGSVGGQDALDERAVLLHVVAQEARGSFVLDGSVLVVGRRD